METEWAIGTAAKEPSDEEGKQQSAFNLLVQISEEEHGSLRRAVATIRETMRGVLFRLVFENHRALKDFEARMWETLTSDERRHVDWGEAQIQTQLAFANWLGSVRWLLDHTRARLHDEPEKLKRVRDATRREFDNHFAYRLTYKLRDYTTHCDLPPIATHVSSKAVGVGGRTDTLSLQLIPADLLDAWDEWGARVNRDLTERAEPIDLVPLIDDAMESSERVMTAILAEDVPKHQAAARLIVDAVDRLPEGALDGDAVPVLFSAKIEEGTISNLSPTPLPIAEAREILSPPTAPGS